MNKHKNRKFWRFQAAASDSGVGELFLYGEIANYTWWGDEVTPLEFKNDLDALGDIRELRVYINSPGGDVFASHAIHSMLKRHKSHVVVYVDGLAASGASIVAMAGDEIIMPANAMMMIHNAWTIGIGDSNEFRKLADELDKINESLIAAYAGRTGLDEDTLASMLDAETWLTAEEAVELGFADTLEESKQVAASLRNGALVVQGHEFDLSRYRNPPKLAFLPAAAESPPDDPEPDLVPEPDPDNETDDLERAKAVLALELELLHAAPF